MKEISHPALLNRDEARQHVEKAFREQLLYLTDIVNYGSNLIVRALGPTSETLAKQVVCAGLLKHLVGMLDAAVVLLESGHSTHAFPQIRSAFEASLYIEIILKKQSEYRAQAYLVGEYRKKRAFAMSVLDNSGAPGSFNAKFTSIGLTVSDLDAKEKSFARETIENINSILAQAPLNNVDAEFQSKSKKRNRDPIWHQVFGFESLYQIAQDLNQSAAYALWYDHGSSVMHADSLSRQVANQDGYVVLKPLRNLEDADQICAAIGQTALKTYRLILSHYRPLELNALQEKYLRDWQTIFRSSKTITYNFHNRKNIQNK